LAEHGHEIGVAIPTRNDVQMEMLGDAGARALLKDLWALETLKNVEFDYGARAAVRAAM